MYITLSRFYMMNVDHDKLDEMTGTDIIPKLSIESLITKFTGHQI